VSSAAKYLPVRPPATPDLPALPAAPELVNNLGGLLPLDCAIAKNGRDGNARALALAQFHDPPPLQVESASGRSPGARQDQSWESTELYLSALLARYVSLAAPELGSLDKLINLHLATTRPPRDIGRVQEQCQSHLRVGVTGSGRACGGSPPAKAGCDSVQAASPDYVWPGLHLPTSPIRLLRHARQSKGLAVVPGQGSSRLPPRLQALLAARTNISGMQWIRLREGLGGRDSWFASRETMRAAATVISKEPGRQVRTDERGAHLVAFQSAL